MQETQVRSLGREDPLEKETATHSSVLAWKIPWTEDPGGLQTTGMAQSDVTERALAHCKMGVIVAPFHSESRGFTQGKQQSCT